MNEGPRMDIITESMLDRLAYQEVKLDIKLITSLGRDVLLTLLRFSPSTWVPQRLLFSSSTLKISSTSFHLLQANPAFLSLCTSTDVLGSIY
jgi:hypothetical protein